MKCPAKNKSTKIIKTQTAPKSRRSLKSLKILLFLSIIIFEAGKMILLKGINSEDVFPVLPESLVSVLLFIGVFYIERYASAKKKPRFQIIKEICLLISFVLYLIALQSCYLPNKSEDADVEVYSRIMLVHGMFAVFLLSTNLLEMSFLPKIIIVIYYFIYFIVKYAREFNENNAEWLVNIITPGVHLVLLILLQSRKKINKIPQQEQNIQQKTTLSNNHLQFLQMIDETVVICDNNGEFQLLNDFCLPKVEYNNPISLFNKIKNIKLRKEEILKSNFTFQNDFIPSTKIKTFSRVVIDMEEDSQFNLTNLLKSTLNNIKNKETTDSKLFYYSGELAEENLKENKLQIKIYTLPYQENPVVAILKNDSDRIQLKNSQNYEQVNKGIINSFYYELKRLVDLSKSLIVQMEQESDSDYSRSMSASERKPPDVISPLFQSLDVMGRIIEDNIQFCCEGAREIQFKYSKCNIRSILEGVANIFRGYSMLKDVTLNFHCPPESQCDFTLYTDKDRLFQLSIQLIYNALRFTQNDTVSFILTNVNKTFKILIKDPGSVITESELIQIQNDLQNYDPDFLKFFSNYQRNQGLQVANTLAKGLSHRPFAGLNIQSKPETGTDVWFFVDNYVNPQDNSKSGQRLSESSGMVKSNSSQRISYRTVRPSIFKLSKEYQSKDTMDSFTGLSESVEVGNVESPTFTNILPNQNPLIKTSPKVATPQFKNNHCENLSFPFSVDQDQEVTRGKPNVIIISEDIAETNTLIKISFQNGYNCACVPFWDKFDFQNMKYKSKISMILIDLEYLSREDHLQRFRQLITKGRKNFEELPLLVGIYKKEPYGDLKLKNQSSFINTFLSKPLDKNQILRLFETIS